MSIDLWISPEGEKYRSDFHKSAKFIEDYPLEDNVAVLELVADLEKHSPRSILEIGCGFGRFLEQVTMKFDQIKVDGCDISKQMLLLCPSNLSVFQVDVCEMSESVKDVWDVAYSRCIFSYLDTKQIRSAVKSISSVVKTMMIIYEWPFVCDKMREILAEQNDIKKKFEFHEVEFVEES